jgi:hypothetical protein
MPNNPILKYCIILFSFILLTNRVQCQIIGIQTSYLKPSAVYGQIFKPTVGFEIFYSDNDIDDRFKVSFLLGYYSFPARHDTFLTYATGSGGAANFLPGFNIWKNYKVISPGGNMEFKILDKNFSPIVGLDVYFYIISYQYQNYIVTLINEQETNSIGAVAVLPKVGVSYELNKKFLIMGGLGKSFGYQSDYITQSYWKVFLKLGYYFGS